MDLVGILSLACGNEDSRLGGKCCSAKHGHSNCTVALQVRRHEPCSALDGGDGGGTESLDRVCTGAVPMLRPGGFLALETAGGSQAHQVVDFLAALDTTLSGGDSAGLDLAGDRQPSQCADSRTPAAAFTRIQVVPDMFGVDRFVTARRT